MKRIVLVILAVVVAAILVLSLSPLRYSLHQDRYSVASTPTENLTDLNPGTLNSSNPWSGITAPPNFTSSNLRLVYSVMINISGVPSTSAGHEGLLAHYWALVNNSTGMVYNIVLVKLNATGGESIAPGTFQEWTNGYRSSYQYSSFVSMTNQRNSSALNNFFLPDNTIALGTPSTWYFSYGSNNSLPFGSPSYGEGIPPSHTTLSMSLGMSYFWLDTVHMTGHSSAWSFYDMNYQHSLGMSQDAYIVSNAFNPSPGINYVTLNLTGVFYHSSGFVHDFSVVSDSYQIPLNLTLK